MLRFHGSRDKQTFELVGTNSRLDAIQAAALRVFLPHLEGWNDGAPRGSSALRRARARRGGRAAARRAGPRVPHVRRPHARSRAVVSAALTEAGIASASYYVTPLHLQPAMRYLGYEPGSLPETERAAAENLALPAVGHDRRRRAGAGRRSRPRRDASQDENRNGRQRAGSPSLMYGHGHREIAVQPTRSVADRRRRGDHRDVLGARLDAAVRPGTARSTTTTTSTGRSSSSSSGSSSPCSGWPASTTAGGGTSRRVTCGRRSAASRSPRSPRSSSSRSSSSTRPASRRGVWFIDLLLCLAFVAGSRLLARTLIERPLPGPGRRPRQGGDHRRCRRRGAARDQGDAAEPQPRVHADRDRRRRPAQAQPPPPRDPRARHHRRPAAGDPRPPSRRGADRDAVRLR